MTSLIICALHQMLLQWSNQEGCDERDT